VSRRRLPALLLLLAACAAPPAPPAAPAARDHVLVLLRSGPAAAGMPAEERQRLQAEHMQNIGRMAEARTLLMAGPFGRDHADPTLRGLYVFDVADTDAAHALAASDPAVSAGVLAFEAHVLSTAADLRALIARDLADEQARHAAGNTDVAAGMRAWVLVLGHDARRAGPALDAHPATRLAGRFRGDWEGRSLHVQDAADPAAARAQLDALPEPPGTVELLPWFGSANLGLPAPAAR